MKVAIYRKNGNPAEVIELIEEIEQEPKSNEVVVSVEATPIHPVGGFHLSVSPSHTTLFSTILVVVFIIR